MIVSTLINSALLLIPFTSTAQVANSTPDSSTTYTASSTGVVLEDRPYILLSGPHCLRFNRNLSEGTKGSDVKSLQAELTLLGFLTIGDVTGVFGSTTKTAMVQFQSAYTISNSLDGRAGPLTRAFFAAYCPIQVKVIIPISTSTVSTPTSTRASSSATSISKYSTPNLIKNVSVPTYIPQHDPFPVEECIGVNRPDVAYFNSLFGGDTCLRYTRRTIVTTDYPEDTNSYVPSSFRIKVSTSTPGTVIITTGPTQ